MSEASIDACAMILCDLYTIGSSQIKPPWRQCQASGCACPTSDCSPNSRTWTCNWRIACVIWNSKENSKTYYQECWTENNRNLKTKSVGVDQQLPSQKVYVGSMLAPSQSSEHISAHCVIMEQSLPCQPRKFKIFRRFDESGSRYFDFEREKCDQNDIKVGFKCKIFRNSLF